MVFWVAEKSCFESKDVIEFVIVVKNLSKGVVFIWGVFKF